MSILDIQVYLRVRDVEEALGFYARAFGACERMRLSETDGRPVFAMAAMGERQIMIGAEFPPHGFYAPAEGQRVPLTVHLHVDDADACVRQAVSAGATLVHEVQTQFYGERSGRVRDPFGYEWLIGHTVESLTSEEMQRRMGLRGKR